MNKSPGVTWSGDYCRYHHDLYEDTFDPNVCCKEQADYLAKHSEITTLAALFVSRAVQRKVWCRNTLKEAGLFFTRSADILDDEVKQELERTGKSEVLTPRPKEEKATIETDFYRTNREELPKVSFSESKPEHTASVESLYSGFVTESTSASTMLVEVATVEEPSTSKSTQLTEFMHQLILNSMNTGLDEMYDTRKSVIVYDEAYLCLMRSIQVIVETKWNPIIDDFKELFETMLDEVRHTALERHLMKLRAIDKVPFKVERLKNNYRGFSSEENKPPTHEEIVDTLKKRKPSYNRYPKDAFGVYISSKKERNSSVASEFSDYEFSSDSLDSLTPSHRSYASTCLTNRPLLLPLLPRSRLELPTLKSNADLPVPIPTNSTVEQLIVPTLPNSSVSRPIVPTAKSISFQDSNISIIIKDTCFE